MKKRLIFEVEEGITHCDKCPFGVETGMVYYRILYSCGNAADYFDCNSYDLSTLKFIEEDSSTINKQCNEND